MIVFLHSSNQDKGARSIDFCMQLASLSALEDEQVQRSFLVQSALLGCFWGLLSAKAVRHYGTMALWR